MCQICDGSGWIPRDGGVVACVCRKNKPSINRQLTEKELVAVTIEATKAATALSAIPDYPYEKEARKMVADALIGMCSIPEEIRFIVRRAIALHNSWKRCGVPGLRQILCSKYKSRDGLECSSTDSYPDGIPSEKDGRTGYEQIEAGKHSKPKALTAGKENAAADEVLIEATAAVARKKSLPRVSARVDDECSRKLDSLDRGYAIGGQK